MVVQTRDRRPGRVGLHIGAQNVREFFPRDVRSVELELDHLRIVCMLEPSFWLDDPEIHDFRLSSWLVSKRNTGKLAAQAAPVALIPSADRSFRLQILRKDDADSAVLAARTEPPPAPSAVVSVAAIRRRNKERRESDMAMSGSASAITASALTASPLASSALSTSAITAAGIDRLKSNDPAIAVRH